MVTHLENGCRYFKGVQAFDDRELDTEKTKEFSHRFFVDAKDLETVTAFTLAGNTFLLIFSRTSSTLFTFNILNLGSDEECKAWKVRLEVCRWPKKVGMGLVSVVYEGPPASINQGCRSLPWTSTMSKQRSSTGKASMDKRRGPTAGVVVNDEMISNVSSLSRGGAYFLLNIKFHRSEEADE